MNKKLPSAKRVSYEMSADIDFLIGLYDRAPKIARKIHGLPPKRRLVSLKKQVEKLFDRIERKEKEIDEIEKKISTLLLARKDEIKDAKKISAAVIRNKYPEDQERLGL